MSDLTDNLKAVADSLATDGRYALKTRALAAALSLWAVEVEARLERLEPVASLPLMMGGQPPPEP